MRLLLVDNHDSYTYNLFQLLSLVCGGPVTVVTNDDPRLAGPEPAGYDAMVISPGPGRPQRATDLGWCRQVFRRHPGLPVLGVCLGHQALAHEAGGEVVEGTPRHGHLSRVRHDGEGLFAGLPQGFVVTRYHSLHVAEPVPAALAVAARADDGVVMAVRDRRLPRWGVQFHPESVATEYGDRLVANFARLAEEHNRATGRTVRRGAVRRPPARRTTAVAGPRELRVSIARTDHAVDAESAFRELYAARPYAFWLDSSEHAEGRGRFSFLGDDSGPLSEVLLYRVGAGHVEVRRGGVVSREPGTVFDVLDRRLRSLSVAEADPPFDLVGGYVGYFGYEVKADCGARVAHTSSTPDAFWMFADRLVAVDHSAGVTYAVAVHADEDAAEAKAWLDGTIARLRGLAPAPRPAPAVGVPAARPQLARDRDQYLADIKRCGEELRRGESYEICLTNRMYLPPVAEPLRFYSALRAVNPAPYAAFLRLGEVSVMSSSPECFLRIHRDRTVVSKPIKGTAPRDADPRVDEEYRSSLVTSAKSRAENLMILDLLRNDLGRVCEVGSVEVPAYMATETYATVHQLVSTIRGRLLPDVSAVQCVRSCFPGGSMTGAPKLRTMEIIDRLEGEARGVYSGALGYFGLGGGADLSIVIRTAVATPEGTLIGTGGAIVMDSDPEEEFAETMLKARALLRAYALAQPAH